MAIKANQVKMEENVKRQKAQTTPGALDKTTNIEAHETPTTATNSDIHPLNFELLTPLLAFITHLSSTNHTINLRPAKSDLMTRLFFYLH